MASTSTETPSGKLLVLTAALACTPISPNIEAIKSDAPLITLGWSVKVSVEFTKPVNFTQVLIFDKWAGVAVSDDIPDPGDAIPVTFVGVGEGFDDLRAFNPIKYVDGIIDNG